MHTYIISFLCIIVNRTTPFFVNILHFFFCFKSKIPAALYFVPIFPLDIFPLVCYNLFMADIYYAPRPEKSLDFASFVLHNYYALKNVRFFTSKHGKPYCDAPFYFSLSHTKRLIFLCVAGGETGIDAEDVRRRGNYSAIKNRLSPCERMLADTSDEEFLKLWTMREATAKYLDLPVFTSFSRLKFQARKNDGERMRAEAFFPFFCGKALSVNISAFELDGHYVSVCLTHGENVEKIRFINGI